MNNLEPYNCQYCTSNDTDETYVNEAGGMRDYESRWHIVNNEWVECLPPNDGAPTFSRADEEQLTAQADYAEGKLKG